MEKSRMGFKLKNGLPLEQAQRNCPRGVIGDMKTKVPELERPGNSTQ